MRMREQLRSLDGQSSLGIAMHGYDSHVVVPVGTPVVQPCLPELVGFMKVVFASLTC
jgi:hypothetical protein